MANSCPFKTLNGGFRKPPFKGYTTRSQYVEMRDGTKIAVDVLLPKPREPEQKHPTILIQTRYWRAIELKPPFSAFLDMATNPAPAKNMVKYGYAIATVDVRGTGASHGTRTRPIDKPEILDGRDIMDWIIKQPWSDGNVLSWGNSYTGMTSEASLSLKHPAMKGAIVRHDPWDLYNDVFLPGGVYNKGFIGHWSRIGKALDTTKGSAMKAFKAFNPLFGTLAPLFVRGVKPVTTRADLSEPARIHLENKYPDNYGELVEFRDDTVDEDDFNIDNLSLFSYKEAIEASGTPIFCFGSWLDSNTANVVIHRFLTYSNPQVAVITDWNHTAHRRANPFYKPRAPASLSTGQQVQEWVSFFDRCLDGTVGKEKILHYFTMGEEKWHETRTWPPDGFEDQEWFLSRDKTLVQDVPPGNGEHDKYKVDFNVTTGIRNRWYTLLTLPVDYSPLQRQVEAGRLLTYTSSPLEEDIEITGHPVVDLFISTTHEDGITCAYLEFIDERGKAGFITDGQLRFVHRKTSEDEPFYRIPYLHHSFLRKDALPVVPGEIMEVSFAMYPTSILLKRGMRLRLSISGADKDSFKRYPATGTPTLSVHRDKDHPSKLVLPVRGDGT